MAANLWVSVKGKKKIAIFVTAVAAVIVFLESLPPAVGSIFSGRYGGRSYSLARVMLISWVAGWFICLFVRAEDRDIVTPVDYQGYCKLVGAFLILGAIVIAGIYLIALSTYKNA